MTLAEHSTLLASSDTARFILFGVIMTALLGTVGLANYMDQRVAKRQRERSHGHDPVAARTERSFRGSEDGGN